MKNFMVSYDLHQPGRDYDKIINALDDFYSSEKLTESCWLIKTNLSAVEVREYLTNFIDDNDTIAVIELGQNWATNRVMKSANNWLRSNLG